METFWITRCCFCGRDRAAEEHCTQCGPPGESFFRAPPRFPPTRERLAAVCPECAAWVELSHPWSITATCSCGNVICVDAPRAKVFTRADEQRSLHHMMAFAFRPVVADEDLTARERHRFVFVCGGCAARHDARAWDIATQRRCDRCDALMIIPAPVRRFARPRTEHMTPDVARYCGRCGQPHQRTHRDRAEFCANCGSLL